MERYRVFIERVERYSHQVSVDADSKAEAERKVRAMDSCNAFENEWNELQPGVETTYEAEREDI
jgi:hypothetical protein